MSCKLSADLFELSTMEGGLLSKFAKFIFLEYYLEYNNPSRATSIAYKTFEHILIFQFNH